jgi:hypothetical protein
LDVEENMFQKSIEYIFLHVYFNAERFRGENLRGVAFQVREDIPTPTEGAFHL